MDPAVRLSTEWARYVVIDTMVRLEINLVKFVDVVKYVLVYICMYAIHIVMCVVNFAYCVCESVFNIGRKLLLLSVFANV